MAGQPDRGIRFTAEMGVRNFVIAGGNSHDIESDITAFKSITSRLQANAEELKRDVGTIALFKVFASDTDDAAMKRFEHIVEGADEVAIANLVGQAELDKSEGMSESLKRKSMFMGLPTLVGSYDTVANYLDRIYDEAGVDAYMFAFPDLCHDVDTFGEHILPKLESRKETQTGSNRAAWHLEQPEKILGRFCSVQPHALRLKYQTPRRSVKR